MSLFKSHHSHSEIETLTIAKNLSKTLNSKDIVFLNGPLGAGKSVMARGIIRSLTQNPLEDIPSPTFTLMQQYDTPAGILWHYDLYRLNQAEEIYETGWEDILYQDILLIEWAEKLDHLTPHRYINIEITPKQNDERIIDIQKVGF